MQLLGPRLKLMRASECLDATLKEAQRLQTAAGWIEPDPTHPGAWLVIWRVHSEVSPVVAVMLGEALHDMRTALDHVVARCVERNGGQVTSDHQFPIVDTAEKWKAAIRRRRLAGIQPTIETIIDAAQPYQVISPLDHYLAVVRDANNVDKHRTLPVQNQIMRGADFTSPLVDATGGVDLRDFIVERLIPQDEDVPLPIGDTPLLRIRPAPWLSGESHPRAQIGLQTGPIKTGIRFEFGAGRSVGLKALNEHLVALVNLVDEIDGAL